MTGTYSSADAGSANEGKHKMMQSCRERNNRYAFQMRAQMYFDTHYSAYLFRIKKTALGTRLRLYVFIDYCRRTPVISSK